MCSYDDGYDDARYKHGRNWSCECEDYDDGYRAGERALRRYEEEIELEAQREYDAMLQAQYDAAIEAEYAQLMAAQEEEYYREMEEYYAKVAEESAAAAAAEGQEANPRDPVV